LIALKYIKGNILKRMRTISVTEGEGSVSRNWRKASRTEADRRRIPGHLLEDACLNCENRRPHGRTAQGHSLYHELGNNTAYSSSEMSDARYIQPHSRCCSASSPVTCHSHTALYSTVKINEAGSSEKNWF